MDPALRDAVLGANNIQAPASPLGASNGAELANLYRSSFQLPQSSGAIAAGAEISSQRVKAAEAQKKLDEQKKQDLADIAKYRAVRKQDGGYDFYDPEGNQVAVSELAQRTGMKPQDILYNKTLGTDSENPMDIQFREDHANLNEYINAVLSKDKKKIEEFRQSRKELNQYDDRGGIDRLINDFKNSYRRYYVTREEDPSAWGEQVGNVVVPARQTGTSFNTGSGAGIGG